MKKFHFQLWKPSLLGIVRTKTPEADNT